MDSIKIDTNLFPIKINESIRKGRGLFVTRDVKKGELLLKENSIVLALADNFGIYCDFCGDLRQDNVFNDKRNTVFCQKCIIKSYTWLDAFRDAIWKQMNNRKDTIYQRMVERLLLMLDTAAASAPSLNLKEGCCQTINHFEINPRVESFLSQFSTIEAFEFPAKFVDFLDNKPPSHRKEHNRSFKDFEGYSCREILWDTINNNTFICMPSHIPSKGTLLNIQNFGKGLFFLGSLINHNCDFNSNYVVVKGTLHIIAERDICSGEEVTIAYKKGHSIGETQFDLYYNYGFRCTCLKCKSCENCGKNGANLTCGKCMSVRYCDKLCQNTCWSKHKSVCAKIADI